MSTLDVVNQVGGEAANFLDIGGGANADVMAAALEVINFDQNVKSIFINIFGGITRGEEVAKGIVEALGRVELRAPIVIRLDGTNAEEGRQILARRRHPGDRSCIRSRRCSTRPAPPSRIANGKGELTMAIFVNADTKVIVQGLTGGQGKFHGLRNRDYGTQVVGGVTPGKGGQDVEGIPVFDSVAEAVAATGADGVVRRRAAEGRAGGDPRGGRGRHRVRRVHHRGHPGPGRGARSSTRSCATSRHPPARPELPRHHQPRQVQHRHHAGEIAQLPTADGPNVGIVSRSGTLTYQALYELKQNGHRRVDVRRHRRRPGARHQLHRLPGEFQADPETHAIIMIGEIGGSAEEEAAEFIKANVTKPMSAYIAGVTAPAGKKMGHAGAIVSRRQGHGAGQDGRPRRGRRAGRPQPDRGRRADGRASSQTL